MLKKFRNYIEHSDWDDQLDRSEQWLSRFCAGVLIISACYFGGIMLWILIRGPIQ